MVKEVRRELPFEEIVYFGDTARVPYGAKSKETVIRFSIENILFLLKQNVKLIIIACNTSSSVALGIAEKNFKVPVIGVIRPGAKAAVKITKNRKIGVIGTRTTIKSGAYREEIRRLLPETKVYSSACPLFVPLVEEGWLKDPAANRIAASYLKELKSKGIDTLVLGCTHYPLLKPVIRKVMGRQVALVDSARQVACQAREILTARGLNSKRKKQGQPEVRFFVSDEPENFALQGKKFLGFPMKKVKKVSYV